MKRYFFLEQKTHVTFARTMTYTAEEQEDDR
jgi:hypothetical protein